MKQNSEEFHPNGDDVFARIAAHDNLLRGISDMPRQKAFCAELESYGITQVKQKTTA